ncbi:hypothetical protein TSTA_002480 [Talaromyces stipitatus ATCC 10500]|uniref:Uncharacterized protein n=1 Tax=Talaromyces stipitatus (strain ATCC 10500 / CBS 375.48 / QM 6759 / NRRL 1006) TaxID=441959 RepID=B8MTD7_TALSN|nr:uncharacterized protein TSTA_002480 [Talaromyces stipitatus ATCC 10500]EED12182.1 hypothetical protein TSTA_002480 [Talaromyces stipitatus ATCC 10500]
MSRSLSDLPVDVILLYKKILRAEHTFNGTWFARRENPNHWTAHVNKWSSELLLSYFRQASIDILQRGFSIFNFLHLVAREGNPRLAEILVNKGLELDMKDFAKRTPLHIALIHHQEDTAIVFLNAGADVMLFKGYALLLAAENCSSTMVERILKKMDALQQPVTTSPTMGFPQITYVQHVKNIALTAATIRQARGVKNVLIRHGADPHWQTDSPLCIGMFRTFVLTD